MFNTQRLEAMAMNQSDISGKRHDFSTTHWSVILDAVQTDSEQAFVALEKLCARYWTPVFTFLRKRGHDLHEAQDLTQGFFEFVLARRAFQTVHPQKGKFRSFMLAALNNFVHNERDREQTLKRGGGRQIISLDDQPEVLLHPELVDHYTPERQFERTWAITIVGRALGQLRAEQAQRGKAALFAGLQPFLTGEPKAQDYEELAGRLGGDREGLKVTLHRLRRRFGELLRREVAYTVSQPEEIEPEIRYLLGVIADSPP